METPDTTTTRKPKISEWGFSKDAKRNRNTKENCNRGADDLRVPSRT
jgi:hypothetical protein